MISGMYMGEVVRQVLVDLVNEDLIFSGLDTDSIKQRGKFETRYVSEIESDQVHGKVIMFHPFHPKCSIAGSSVIYARVQVRKL